MTAPQSLSVIEADLPTPETEGDISILVGENLRRLRTRNGLSLERLAKASGVSRAMLGQIELGRSAPTINVLWKIARALDVPVSAFTSSGGGGDVVLLRAHRAKWLSSRNGRFSSRALFPFTARRREEFYEMRITAQTVEEAEAHPPGTTENLVVTKGVVEVVVAGRSFVLEVGDALYFVADTPHAYRNPGQSEAVLYLVMTYCEQQG